MRNDNEFVLYKEENDKYINRFSNWKGDTYFLYNKGVCLGPQSIKPIIASFCSYFFPSILFISFNGSVRLKLI